MFNPWSVEIWRMTGLAFFALLLGLLVGQVLLALFLTTLAYLAWHLVNLSRLERWLRTGTGAQPAEGKGIWGDVNYHLYRLRKRHWRRKRTISTYLNRLRALTAAMPDGTVVLRTSGEIEWFNDAAGRLLGLRSPDIGQRLINLVRQPAFVDFMEAGRYGEPVEFISPVDPGVILEVSAVPFGQEQILLVARDVTRVHRLEQVRRDFVANVSHELRTPLTVINGFLETMADARDTKIEEWAHSLRLMSQQTSRMQHLVEDLLLLSRLETEAKRPAREAVEVPKLLEAIYEEAKTLSGGEHLIRLDVDRNLGLRGNEPELRSAFINLVSNAIRYTPSGGIIDIRWYADESGAHFAVRDTGTGIAAHHIPRLTERFYRVDVARSRQSGGTGLGLAIVKHVLERHEAELHITSKLGQGSTFCCDFPASLVVNL